MTPSSLKKMSGDQERKEGSYASPKKTPWGRFTNHDLGLTLLPGSQIQRTDEKRSGTSAESNPKKPGSKQVEISQPRKSFKTETLPEHPAQERAVLDGPSSPISSPDPDPESAEFSQATVPVDQDRRFTQSKGVAPHRVNSVVAAGYDEEITGTGETSDANGCQHDDCPSDATKWTKLGSRAMNGMRDLKVSREREAACKTPHKMHHDQEHSQNNDIYPEKKKPSVATFGISWSGIGGSPAPSKPNACRQITRSSDTARAYSQQNPELEDLIMHYQSTGSLKPISMQNWKHLRLLPDTTASIRNYVLKPGPEVNRSWTSHFPAKPKTPQRAKLPAPLLAAPFTPGEGHRHLCPISSFHTSTSLHARTQFSSSYPSSSLSSNLSLYKFFDYPLNARRRSASLPNLASTCTSMNMDFSHSMPTPPQDQPSSPTCFPSILSYHNNTSFHQNILDLPRGQVDTSFHADDTSSQNWQSNSNFQHRHEISLSRRQDIGFASRSNLSQALTQSSYHQHVTDPSLPKDGTMAAGGSQYSSRRLGVKPNYSYEEVKSLVPTLEREMRTLRAENTKLQSVNTAMKKGFESLQQENAGLTQQIEHYEQVVAQKDKQIGAMQQSGCTLQRQYKRVWNEHHRLLAAIRKEDGTGNPSSIAQRIRLNHSPSAVGAATYGRQTNANVANASSQASEQPVFAAANHNSADLMRNGSTRWGYSDHPCSASVSTVATISQNSEHPVEKVSRDCVTINLTDDSQPPSFLASRDEMVCRMHQSSVQAECLPFSSPPGQYPQADHPIHNSKSQSGQPPDQDSQGRDLEAMEIQREAISRMAEKPLSWLVGKHPFREGAETGQRVRLPNARRSSQSNEEQNVLSAQSSAAGSVAPLPETGTGRKATRQTRKQPKVVLNAEAKKERAKGYRKNAVEKKKREKENAKQLIQKGNSLDNAMRVQKQDRRAAKAEKRLEQVRKPSEEVGPQEPQKTLDDRLYQEDVEVKQAMHGSRRAKPLSDDQDSLFTDGEENGANSPDADIVMYDDDDDTADAAMAAAIEAELEAELEAEAEAEAHAGVDADADGEADAERDAGQVAPLEQGDGLGGQTCVSTAISNDDHEHQDFCSESEEE